MRLLKTTLLASVCLLAANSYAADPIPLVSQGTDTPAEEYRDYLIHFITGNVYCTGQFIHPRFILTNAHCVGDPNPNGEQSYELPVTVYGGMRKFDSNNVIANTNGKVHRLVWSEISVEQEYRDYLEPLINQKMEEWSNEAWGDWVESSLILDSLSDSSLLVAADLALIELPNAVSLESIALPRRSMLLTESMSMDRFIESTNYLSMSWVARGFGTNGDDSVPDPTVLQQFYPKFAVNPHAIQCSFYQEGHEDSWRFCDGQPMVNEKFGLRVNMQIEAISFDPELPYTAAQKGDSGSGIYQRDTDFLYTIMTHLYSGTSFANGSLSLDHVLPEIGRRINSISAPTRVTVDAEKASIAQFYIQNHTPEDIDLSALLGNIDHIAECGDTIRKEQACLLTFDLSHDIAATTQDFTKVLHFGPDATTTIRVQMPYVPYSGNKSGGGIGLGCLVAIGLLSARKRFVHLHDELNK